MKQENESKALKAIADETRLKIVKLLLAHNYCVGALARHLELTEAAISQHLKVLKEAGLLIGNKHGYFMHYDVNREELLKLSNYIKDLIDIQRNICKPEDENCLQSKRGKCHVKQFDKKCSAEVKHFCHGEIPNEMECGKHGNCECNKS